MSTRGPQGVDSEAAGAGNPRTTAPVTATSRAGMGDDATAPAGSEGSAGGAAPDAGDATGRILDAVCAPECSIERRTELLNKGWAQGMPASNKVWYPKLVEVCRVSLSGAEALGQPRLEELEATWGFVRSVMDRIRTHKPGASEIVPWMCAGCDIVASCLEHSKRMALKLVKTLPDALSSSEGGLKRLHEAGKAIATAVLGRLDKPAGLLTKQDDATAPITLCRSLVGLAAATAGEETSGLKAIWKAIFRVLNVKSECASQMIMVAFHALCNALKALLANTEVVRAASQPKAVAEFVKIYWFYHKALGHLLVKSMVSASTAKEYAAVVAGGFQLCIDVSRGGRDKLLVLPKTLETHAVLGPFAAVPAWTQALLALCKADKVGPGATVALAQSLEQAAAPTSESLKLLWELCGQPAVEQPGAVAPPCLLTARGAKLSLFEVLRTAALACVGRLVGTAATAKATMAFLYEALFHQHVAAALLSSECVVAIAAQAGPEAAGQILDTLAGVVGRTQPSTALCILERTLTQALLACPAPARTAFCSARIEDPTFWQHVPTTAYKPLLTKARMAERLAAEALGGLGEFLRSDGHPRARDLAAAAVAASLFAARVAPKAGCREALRMVQGWVRTLNPGAPHHQMNAEMVRLCTGLAVNSALAKVTDGLVAHILALLRCSKGHPSVLVAATGYFVSCGAVPVSSAARKPVVELAHELYTLAGDNSVLRTEVLIGIREYARATPHDDMAMLLSNNEHSRESVLLFLREKSTDFDGPTYAVREREWLTCVGAKAAESRKRRRSERLALEAQKRPRLSSTPSNASSPATPQEALGAMELGLADLETQVAGGLLELDAQARLRAINTRIAALLAPAASTAAGGSS